MNIGEKIKLLRESKGISQRQLATLIKMNPSQYSKIERGLVDPRISTIEKICLGFDITVSDFFLSYKSNESHNSPLLNKVMMVERLSQEEQESIFNLIEKLLQKK